ATPEPTAEPTTPRTEPTHTPSRTAEPTTRTEPPPPNQAPPSDPVGFVQTYYSLLPGNTDAAWAMLSPRAQQESNGRATFDGFYATVQSVTVRNARQTGSNTVQADLAFVNKNGSSSNELYRFVLGTDADGRTTIESFSK
ncbi:serine/threonine protein kinase, partial [Pseudonocardia xinjiangensis]|nr:serine/threonine protein kinase [Pseudonocardia xinjiangensis]